jgi:hypothetical protein
MFKIIVPEVNTWMSGLYDTGKSKSPWGEYLVDATPGEETEYRNSMPVWEEEVGSLSDFYQTIVFAPAKTVGQIANTTFDGVDHISQYETQWINKIQSSSIEVAGRTKDTGVEAQVEAGNVYNK